MRAETRRERNSQERKRTMSDERQSGSMKTRRKEQEQQRNKADRSPCSQLMSRSTELIDANGSSLQKRDARPSVKQSRWNRDDRLQETSERSMDCDEF